MVKARKKASRKSPAPTTTAASPPPRDNTMSLLPRNSNDKDDDVNGKNHKRGHHHGTFQWTPHQFLHSTRKILNIVQKIIGILTSTTLTVLAMLFIIASELFVSHDKELQSRMGKLGVTYLFIGKPLLSTLMVCCGNNYLQQQQTENNTVANAIDVGGNWHERIIAASFLLSIVCTQFPKALSALVASCAVFAFGLASRQTVSQHNNIHASTVDIIGETTNSSSLSSSITARSKSMSNPFKRIWYHANIKERATIGTLAVVLSLLLENFLIWVVSATYSPGITGSPDALQDNGRLVLESLVMKLLNVDNNQLAKRSLQKLRDALNVQWALVAGFGGALVCLELQLGGSNGNQKRKVHLRTLSGLALHALMTLASARLIRTISFVLTVLPSQVPNCYRRHFPYPPPDTWKEWLMVGFLPNSRGGCNDLILSGHATVTSTLGCAATSVASNTKFSLAVWTLVALDYSIEAYQGLHYSVDMWLGCIVTCLLWQLTKPLEVEGEWEQVQKSKMTKVGNRGHILSPVPPLDAAVVAMYAFPASLGFVILTMVPEAVVNYFLVGYAVWAGGILVKWGQTNFSQHILLCLLVVTLGAYL